MEGCDVGRKRVGEGSSFRYRGPVLNGYSKIYTHKNTNNRLVGIM